MPTPRKIAHLKILTVRKIHILTVNHELPILQKKTVSLWKKENGQFAIFGQFVANFADFRWNNIGIMEKKSMD